MLVKSGVDIDVLLDRFVRVQDDLEDAARSFVSIITDKYFDEKLPELGEANVSKMAELIQTVRPMAHDIVETTFRKALDDEISKAIGEASTYFDAASGGPDATAGRDAVADGEAAAGGEAVAEESTYEASPSNLTTGSVTSEDVIRE